MNTIQKKIILLSLFIWVMMLGIWLFMSYHNQKTIEQYNQILQRYLLMNQASHLSENLIANLHQYILDPTDEQLYLYENKKIEMQITKGQLKSLRNADNYMELMDYENMIDSQLELTELVLVSLENERQELAASHLDQATKISDYISEMTLTILNKELKTYNQFYRSIIEQSSNLEKMGFWVLLMTSFLLLLFSYLFTGSITRPILKLTLAFKEISRGKFDRKININSNDEIGFLANVFEHMRNDIKKLIGEMKEKAKIERDLNEHKLLLKESELKSLQSQINPHFLFNTLNTLSKKAYLEEAYETSDLITSVSNLLRYNLRQMGTTVTILEEMKGVQEYLAIQKARFFDRVQYGIDIDGKCFSFEIPSLTIQPFVENAFIHAIEPSEEGGEIHIIIKDQPEHVMICIEDIGKGMSEEQVNAILKGNLSNEYKGHSTGIGTSNVINRLRLHYGVHDVIQISSIPDKGTKITLMLPKRRKDDTK
ncbi:sensor histidine kinase [Chengkuizengella axinellae]|uniref:histidine kinase n=1 Tax=Chengkuizengella axinellae TaxID=3064388 RepID=A0ABT9J5S0_9BACL|nr:sensor histidine kinase [Chengkuizengella sp. 2205SS18-9]MDP5276299.1 sensor histidine kinase [Chengkuizengella sp. 2205SS18-9]